MIGSSPQIEMHRPSLQFCKITSLMTNFIFGHMELLPNLQANAKNEKVLVVIMHTEWFLVYTWRYKLSPPV